ncbi:hypothetical protein [Bacillus siamensis]|uniref:hypothetical protein n=1 Tax=Bacillus siamensis TaxID=659243 RepID=UPI002E1DC361|nr:hypothetical protein [Bacillus siamensis]MED0775890.1 hypothetical protein [Bacillus siamensis]MED0781705.1 hypothetical protein [Bacillus siamensis]MED0832682.1 hypothetical protein [Bacillus siamensis]
MPYETGGRADKFGNRYEGRWVVKQLLRLIKEEISSIILEGIGEEEEGIDLWIRNNDRSKICSQCKGRNASKEYWTIGDLGAKGIFQKAKKQLDSSDKISYQFVSAVNSMMLNDITNRARNSNGNPRDFYEYQIKNSTEVYKEYRKICEYFGLDHSSVQDNEQAFHYLKRMHVIHYSDDLETKLTLKETIKYLFIGNPETIYNLLLSYPIENDLLGKEISSYMIINFLESQPDISFRQLHKDERIMPRIEYLNNEFDSAFVKINNSLMHRQESEKCYKELLNGNSVIIHGKAGSGKSGCVIELRNKLKEKNIVHLALKLDRRVPEYSSNNYGDQLGLSASPVFCIDAVSKDKEAVLILDQLDAIRWTNNHSSTALEVCKEMIAEVNNINKERDGKITLVFICRTFDFQNDNGIKQLFSKMNTNYKEDTWKEIIMSDLDNDSVKEVVGETYNNLSTKLKLLLKTPSNLYIWSNLEEERKSNTYISSSDLIKQWWTQLSINCEIMGVFINDLNELKDTIVHQIDNLGKLMIPVQMVNNCSKVAIEQLLSNGLLFSDGKRIGFVHQSFYDYFLVEKMIQQIFEGNSIISILGSPSKQTPSKRYQLQMLLENLLDFDIDDFVDVGIELIQSVNIRFYMKYVFLEVLGQVETINSKVEVFLKEYINSEYWRNHLLGAAFINHPIFIKFLIREGYINTWLDCEQDRELALLLLRSVNFDLPNEVTSLIYPLAFKNPDLDNKIYNVLCWNIADDSDEMFDFRLELLKFRPELWDAYISWEELAKDAPSRALSLIDLIVKNVNNQAIENRQDLDYKAIQILTEIAKDRPYQVWKDFMLYIAETTKNTTSIYDKKIDFWISKKYMGQLYGRAYVEMVKASGKELIKIDAKNLLKSCEKYNDYSSLIINEILLSLMESLPVDCSDYAISWLIENPHTRLFNYTGDSDEYLYIAKKVIEKHSKTCSDEVFESLEHRLYYYHEEDELEIAKRRFEFNRENRIKHNKLTVHWIYWGEVQNYLIPALDQDRISRKSFELERILKRKFNGQHFRHKRNNVIGGFVSSTIGTKAEKISDKQWLKIIEKKDYQKDKWSLKDGPILESSPRQFSRDIIRVGEKDPNRIANLALKFPKDIDNHYISAVFDIIGKKDLDKDMNKNGDWKPVNLHLAQSLYKKWVNNENINVATSFCRGIRERAEELWDKDILNEISNIAMNHLNPEQGEFNVVSSEDKEVNTINSLFTNSMNCVRGCAAEAIASLLWEDKDRYDYFKDAVDSIVNDKNLAVNMSAIECILPIMNFDKEQAVQWFFQLANKDLRIAAHPYAYNLFYNLYKDYSRTIKELVLEMYNSKFEDVAKVGAKHIANMYVLYGSFGDILFKNINKSKEQKEGIVKVACDLIGYQEHHEKCKKIIVHFLDEEKDDDLTFSYSQLLYKEKINIKEDEEFILKLVTSKTTRRMVRRFVYFINENDIPIILFKEVIFGMCQNIIQNSQKEVKDVGSELYGIAQELSKLIAFLYDRTQGDFEVNQRCLDMWDEMFENRIGTMRELTITIMDM